MFAVCIGLKLCRDDAFPVIEKIYERGVFDYLVGSFSLFVLLV